jgi:hypothetical protein
LDVVEVEEDRKPLEDRMIDMDLGGRRGSGPPAQSADTVPMVPMVPMVPAVPPADADDRPPPDAPIDELAAAYLESAEVERPPKADRSALADEMDAAPPAPKGQKHDNLMLYLDTDDEA